MAASQSCNSFLNAVAAAALAGSAAPALPPGAAAKVPLPLHARAVLEKLPGLSADEAVAALKSLLRRAAVVTRGRRAAMVGGCILFPAIAMVGGLFAMSFLGQLSQQNPGLMELTTVLSLRATAAPFGVNKAQLPDERLVARYVAHHHRGLITNAATWSNPFVLSMIKREARQFAERSVAEHPFLSEEEIRQADAVVTKYLPKDQPFAGKPPSWLPGAMAAGSLVIYVSLPALAAALIFRGGLVLLVAGVTFVRKDGARASRLRLFWRSLVTWTPVAVLACLAAVLPAVTHQFWTAWLALVMLGLLAASSVALPERGLQDRLSGTWPVPR